MAVFVRTGHGGADSAYLIEDIGFSVPTGSGWTELTSADGYGPSGGTGQFTTDRLRDSVMLYDAIAAGGLEWSVDGVNRKFGVFFIDEALVHQIVFTDGTVQATAASAGGSSGFVQFKGSDGYFAGDTNLFWDNTNKRLGIDRHPVALPLEVDGYIWTASGGIKFPDLSTQNTAFQGTARVFTSAPATGNGTIASPVSMPPSTNNADGYLIAADHAIFSAKENALTFNSPLSRSTNTVSIPRATVSADGYLVSADFSTFNAKENTLTFSYPLNRATNTISIPAASGLTDGYLSVGAQTIAGAKTFTNIVSVLLDGSATTPSFTIATTPDTDTGLFHPSANNFSVATAGSETARFTADGYIYAPNGGFRFPDGYTLSVLNASGQLSGVYPSPNVIGIRETSGPTNLNIAGISANQIIGRNNSNQLVSTGRFYDPSFGVEIYDEFMSSGGNTFGNLGWTLGTAGSGATGGAEPDHIVDGSHPGVGFLNPGTTTSGRAAYMLQAEGVLFGGGQIMYETLVYVPVLSTATEEFKIYIGFNDTQGGVVGTDPVDSAVFLYERTSSTSWQARTANNSSRTTSSTGVAVVAAAWTKLKIVINSAGSSVEFFVNGNSVATILTNIPTASNRQTGMLYRIDKLATAGANTSLLKFDYMIAQFQFTTPR